MTSTMSAGPGAWADYRPPRRPWFRRRWVWAGASVVIAAVLALVAVFHVRAEDARRSAAWRDFRAHRHVLDLRVTGRGSATIAWFVTPGPTDDHGATKIVDVRLPYHRRQVVPGSLDTAAAMIMPDGAGRSHCRLTLDGRRYPLPGDDPFQFCEVFASDAVG